MGYRWMLWVVASVGCRVGFEPLHSDPDAPADAPASSYTIGGTASGVSGSGLVLLDNGADALGIVMDGVFTFETPLASGTAFDVSIASTPSGQDCTVIDGTGVVANASITRVMVTCFAQGTCPTAPLTFTADNMFVMPEGCGSMIVEAFGGGGAAGKINASATTPAAGGVGGHAIISYTGVAPGTAFRITIGAGGTCAATLPTVGGFTGGAGGISGGGTGEDGGGSLQSLGGLGSGAGEPGGDGGQGGYGGGGGGGGGDNKVGNSGGGATTFQLMTGGDIVIAGGGGGAGAADQDGDVAGAGGDACNGSNGFNGFNASGPRAGGGGGGGACFCSGGACDTTAMPDGGAGGAPGTTTSCTAAQNGTPGHVVLGLQP